MASSEYYEAVLGVMELLIFTTVFFAFLIIFTLEVIAPASKNECDHRWLVMASVISAFQMITTVAVGWFFLDTIRDISILDYSDHSPVAQGVIGFILTSFVAYWWHRAIHKYDFLWRTFHQLHHSPRRIESLTAFYLHPFDGMAATFLNGICCYLVLGLSLEGAGISLLISALYNIFVHADIRTPYWLGWFIQRPEMHRVHHKHMHHSQNYGLIIWDAMFGTYHNPKEYISEVGFDEKRANQIYEMLRTRDVYKKAPNKEIKEHSSG